MIPAWLPGQTHSLLDFALRSVLPDGGFGWLDETGGIDRSQGRPLWITARMTHVMAIGEVMNHAGCAEAVEHGLAALTGLFHDARNGGWYASVGWDGSPTDTKKSAYQLAFVILAAASAVAAGHRNARPLLGDALEISSRHFWDEGHGMIVDDWDETFSHLDSYRGVNSNMHTVEAYLAAAEALDMMGDETAPLWRERISAICARVIGRDARDNQWRVQEHYDPDWHPMPGYNRDRPADQFRPFGAIVGHGLEWSRLCLQVMVSLPNPPDWLSAAAVALFQRAVADGWHADGNDGFVYTTDWDGVPVVHERMHWTLAEALGAGAALQAAGLLDTTGHTDRWWIFADAHVIDHEHGGWHHELNRFNQPSTTVWRGKPDVYHAIQACVLAGLPVVPAIVPALTNRPDPTPGAGTS